MKPIAAGLILGSMTAGTALAEGIVEITHKSLRPGSHAVTYWCLEKDQVPAEYSEPGRYALVEKPADKREGGLLIASYPDTMVFLTTEACLDEALSSYSSYGGIADDLTLTPK